MTTPADSPNAKLTAEQVAEIRSLWPSVSQQKLAVRYGVTDGVTNYAIHYWGGKNRRRAGHKRPSAQQGPDGKLKPATDNEAAP